MIGRTPPPPLEEPAATLEAVTLLGLVEDWRREQEKVGLKPATYTNYKGAFRALVRFLGHDVAGRVRDMDVVAFKDHRLTVVSPRTVKDNDLPALRSVLGWAVVNR